MLKAMLKRARFLLPFLVLGLVLVSLADGDSGGVPRIKVLVVEGVTNHAWQKRLNIVRAILSKDGSFDVDFTVSLERLFVRADDEHGRETLASTPDLWLPNKPDGSWRRR
jgi:hypothetical protein